MHEKDTDPSQIHAQAGIQYDKHLEEAHYHLLYINKELLSQHIVFAGHLPSQV